ncbi:hypothetical protein [uncultured Polaribacter sp.]|uniref:hypothetical protein n=1 Tax=uncultured Polaribacter sp. TaxID=174711 RepID=UPI002613C482|nr:hypothetical protein [uncultured Polaribacter sp.]
MNKEKPNINDYLIATLKGGISAIPFAGGVINEFINLTIKTPIEKKQKQWIELLYKEITNLKEKHKEFETENLAKNERFISSFVTASQIVIKTHENEKINYLKNAVINSVKSDVKSYEQTIFLNYLDIFTVEHINCLKALIKMGFNGPTSASGDIEDIHIGFNSHIPESSMKFITLDLKNKGFIDSDYTLLSNSKIPTLKISCSKLGRNFINFLSK